MWRTILLGKLGISIVATFVVGVACASRPWRAELTGVETMQWIGIGAFFILLGLLQIATIYLLMRPSKPR